MNVEHFDVLVIGAGLSGIGAGYHLQTRCPGKRYAILEARSDLGGTWDLFRYPGVRSDSDMFTLGFSFRPWRDAKAIADGPSILRYIRETAREFGIDDKIRFQHRVEHASWSSEQALWTLDVRVGDSGERQRYSCRFLHLCSGYYRYDQGHAPHFPGESAFQGPVIHPQHWPQSLDYAGRRVVVIGSGATAVTLVPAMADKAAHVTMLQRSPTYVVSLPARDPVADIVRRVLPERLAHRLVRWKNLLLALGFFQFCRRAPAKARRLIRAGVKKQLPADYPVDTHFNPRYQPWDQRLCFVPDGDLFKAIQSGRASIVTGELECFTPGGLRLQSGDRLQADVVVKATGLSLLACGGIEFEVDGSAVDLSRTFTYKGLMLTGIPNMAVCVGYTNSSWTLRSDLVSTYVCRLLNHMDRHGYEVCTPRHDDPQMQGQPLIDLNANYVLRAVDRFPKQGTARPWRLNQNYLLDLVDLKLGPVDDAGLIFSRRSGAEAAQQGRTA